MTAHFDKATRRVIAARAGYRCSFPNCRQLTIGPGAREEEYSLTGTASHIYSASDIGPRGSGSLDEATRSSVSNGIWLCAQHARVVDANRGEKFPAALLKSIRDEHERRIAAEHENLPYYWLEELEFGQNPVFLKHESVRFAKVTLLVGDNGTGKSTIFRWIDQLGGSSRSWDTPYKGRTNSIEYSVVIHNPARRVIRVYRDSELLRFQLDGEEVLFNPIPMEIINYERYGHLFMLEAFLERRRREAGQGWESRLDDVDLVAKYMDINPLVIPSLLPFVGRFVVSPFVNLRVTGEEGCRRIVGDDLNWKDGASIHEVSGSMLSRSVLEMQIAIAMLNAKTRPAALLIDLPTLHFDYDNLSSYVKFFLSPAVRFQVLFTTPDIEFTRKKSELGWSIVELSGVAPYCRARHLSW